MSDNKGRQPKDRPAASSTPPADDTTAKAELAAAVDAPAEETDPRDDIIAQLEAELAAVSAPKEMDAKDRAIADLRAQLAAKTATPEGEAAELRAALEALQREVTRMQEGKGLIPVPDSDGRDPLLYGMVLATGEVIEVAHPHATHHHSDNVGFVVPVTGYFKLAPEHAEAATKAAAAA